VIKFSGAVRSRGILLPVSLLVFVFSAYFTFL
jgi:hypothetical protein